MAGKADWFYQLWRVKAKPAAMKFPVLFLLLWQHVAAQSNGVSALQTGTNRVSGTKRVPMWQV